MLLTACGGEQTTSTQRPAPTPATPTAAPAVPDGTPPLDPLIAEALDAGTPVVAFLHHSEGKFEPCGCVAGMFGGLVRRGSLLARVPRDQRLTLEGGGWSAGGRDFQRIKTRHYLQALELVAVDAVAIGRREVELGAQRLAELLPAVADTAVSANVRRADGTPLAAPLRRVDLGDRRLAVTSVAPTDATGPGMVVADPAVAIQDLLASLDGRELVVLADLDEDALRALATAVPQIALVVGGDVHTPSHEVERVAGTPVVQVANHGKTQGWWPWGGDECRFDMIADSLPDRGDLRARVIAYQEALGTAELRIDHPDDGGMTAIGGASASYVGAAACLGCHQDAHAVHVASRHHHSFATLRDKGYHRDPECLRCHVTALGQPGGFTRIDAPEHLREVSCESCHGPGSQHVATQAALVPVTPTTCIGCHDRENSPHFDYATYWPKIEHYLDGKAP